MTPKVAQTPFTHRIFTRNMSDYIPTSQVTPTPPPNRPRGHSLARNIFPIKGSPIFSLSQADAQNFLQGRGRGVERGVALCDGSSVVVECFRPKACGCECEWMIVSGSPLLSTLSCYQLAQPNGLDFSTAGGLRMDWDGIRLRTDRIGLRSSRRGLDQICGYAVGVHHALGFLLNIRLDLSRYTIEIVHRNNQVYRLFQRFCCSFETCCFKTIKSIDY